MSCSRVKSSRVSLGTFTWSPPRMISEVAPAVATMVAASVALQMQGSTVSKSSIVLGHVAPTPWAAQKASQALDGKALTPETIAQAAEAAGEQP